MSPQKNSNGDEATSKDMTPCYSVVSTADISSSPETARFPAFSRATLIATAINEKSIRNMDSRPTAANMLTSADTFPHCHR